MKKQIFIFVFLISILTIFDGCTSLPQTSQANNMMASEASFSLGNFSVPTGAELLESTELKDDNIPYLIERRYKLPSGEIMYAYYDVEGSNSVTIQKIEQPPLLALGTDVNIPGLPGYREFNFGDDRRQLVQFMKLFKLGKKEYSGKAKLPSLSDSIFRSSIGYRNEYVLLLDLYDATWVLEHREWYERRLARTDTTAIVHVNKYSE
jgi:hypothetical protein